MPLKTKYGQKIYAPVKAEFLSVFHTSRGVILYILADTRLEWQEYNIIQFLQHNKVELNMPQYEYIGTFRFEKGYDFISTVYLQKDKSPKKCT